MHTWSPNLIAMPNSSCKSIEESWKNAKGKVEKLAVTLDKKLESKVEKSEEKSCRVRLHNMDATLERSYLTNGQNQIMSKLRTNDVIA